MTARLKVDFVSDVSCPWCVIGLRSLERALDLVDGEATVELIGRVSRGASTR